MPSHVPVHSPLRWVLEHVPDALCRLQARFDEEQRRAEEAERGKAGPSRVMWVDKYRPKKFSDLLGEDVSAGDPSIRIHPSTQFISCVVR